MDVWLVVAGALFVVWPFQYRRSMWRIEERIAARGRDAERFRRQMDHRWIKAALYIAPVAGVGCIAMGLIGS